jgi:hypothetical protein
MSEERVGRLPWAKTPVSEKAGAGFPLDLGVIGALPPMEDTEEGIDASPGPATCGRKRGGEGGGIGHAARGVVNRCGRKMNQSRFELRGVQ